MTTESRTLIPPAARSGEPVHVSRGREPMAESFDTNLLRLIAAHLASVVAMTVAREMFGKGYFALGVQERAIVDANTFQLTASHYQQLTADKLANPTGPPVAGFQGPPAPPKTA